MTVGIPSRIVSASARFDRSMAWARLAPVTMIFATSESKLPGTLMPSR